ncbi:class I SAM-dependent methyltransferase [Synechococcus sp. CS-1325]|uniref:class I SAM-dependent methyltransferase n=1 Tax=unclassified Synechococcus TaxID=2626047 RepID=UPI0021A4A4D4|nr:MULTISPECIES: class I SAM-dependent methyltransferase [unclassified Synechococcus]MCT0200796.1 class I SAM-dependent methyltransferase [Synechococcus sp. CS-1325]MCT0213835.1 class I SAM-dependent methyltransferase [Synechococcus sp. CS-1326]MCT0233411.1 class I SAM-dependent methyltransferase [Synechococcus sp. CS-1327]
MSELKARLRSDYAILQAKQKSVSSRAASIRRLQRLLFPHLPMPCNRALDLGAGQGELVVALQLLGCSEATGVELSASQVQQALSHSFHSVCQGDGFDSLQRLPDQSLDLITCFDVFEHLPHEVCDSWFAQIRRVLRPGGRLIGHVPNGLSPFCGSVYWGDLTHLWCPVPESVQVFCRSSGLQWIGAYENIGASNGVKGRLRSLAWRVVRSCLATVSTVETGSSTFSWPWSRTFLFVAERERP